MTICYCAIPQACLFLARIKLTAAQVYESLRVAAPLVSYALLLYVVRYPAVSSSRGAAERREAVKYLTLYSWVSSSEQQ